MQYIVDHCTVAIPAGLTAEQLPSMLMLYVTSRFKDPITCAALAVAVNMPGYSYDVDAIGTPSAKLCPLNTYGPGMKKQRACVPCPTGFTTNGRTGQTLPTACGECYASPPTAPRHIAVVGSNQQQLADKQFEWSPSRFQHAQRQRMAK